MTLPLKQRLGGVVFVFLGTFLTIFNWRLVLRQGMFFEKASVAGPAFVVLGLAMNLFKGYKEERADRGEDISSLHGWKLLTPLWRGVLIVALAIGLANYVLIHLTIE